MVDMRARASYRRSPRLNSPYDASSTGACREPGGGPVGNPEREGRRGQGLHVAGHGLQVFSDPRSAPYLGRRGLGTARGWP
jgi:hypothetical protein